jgi:hypothetical protein
MQATPLHVPPRLVQHMHREAITPGQVRGLINLEIVINSQCQWFLISNLGTIIILTQLDF